MWLWGNGQRLGAFGSGVLAGETEVVSVRGTKLGRAGEALMDSLTNLPILKLTLAEQSPKYSGSEVFVKPLKDILEPDGITPLKIRCLEKPLRRFTAHRVPVGMAYLDESFPEGMKNSMLMARFGGFWPVNGITTGFECSSSKI